MREATMTDTAPKQRPIVWLRRDGPSGAHRGWLRSEELRILRFPATVVSERGDLCPFSWCGGAVRGAVSETFNTARVAHVYALAAARGEPGARTTAGRLLDHLGRYKATGWPERPDSGTAEPQSLYTLAFVILAATSGIEIGHGGSRGLLGCALSRLDGSFWENGPGKAVDRVGPDGPSHYRGLNGNMHLAESLFAAGAALGDATLTDRALGLCDFVIREASRRDWRILEHYDAGWNPLPEHNRSRPDDPFFPYGSTVGHGFEWARLIAQTASRDRLSAAIAMFDRAAADGWCVDGVPGFVYTVDWSGRPVSRQRLHWVAAEAVAAASVLYALTGDPRFARRYEEWLDYVGSYLIDHRGGSWHHRLDHDNRPAGRDEAKPDLYHSYQAMLVPQLPVRTSMMQAVKAANV